jgi:hypothetical protein
MFQCNEPVPEPVDGKIRFCTLEMDHPGQHEVWYPNPNSLYSAWLSIRWPGERDIQLHLHMGPETT